MDSRLSDHSCLNCERHRPQHIACIWLQHVSLNPSCHTGSLAQEVLKPSRQPPAGTSSQATAGVAKTLINILTFERDSCSGTWPCSALVALNRYGTAADSGETVPDALPVLWALRPSLMPRIIPTERTTIQYSNMQTCRRLRSSTYSTGMHPLLPSAAMHCGPVLGMPTGLC